jgi:hypothetical protein
MRLVASSSVNDPCALETTIGTPRYYGDAGDRGRVIDAANTIGSRLTSVARPARHSGFTARVRAAVHRDGWTCE